MNHQPIQDRRAHFKIGNAGINTSQDKRRREHLEFQKKCRSNALDSIRGIEDLANCFLIDEDNEQESEDSEGWEGRYEDAPEERSLSENEKQKTTMTSAAQSSAKKPSKKYYKYRDRCMRAEFLELADGLPDRFDQDWVLLGPIPKGKRCLALTLSSNQNHSAYRANINTSSTAILLSRANANRIGRFFTILPPDCIVDCIYDQPNQTLWILDILKWRNQAMIDCEAHFRFWWRDAKFSELSTQSVPDSSSLLCTPVPVTYNFTTSKVAAITGQMLTSSTATKGIKVRPSTQSSRQDPEVLHSIHYETEGLLFYVKSATYESGETVLAGWVPLYVVEEKANDHGICKLNWLCERDKDTMQE